MHAISSELLEADTFDLHCFQSLTGRFLSNESPAGGLSFILAVFLLGSHKTSLKQKCFFWFPDFWDALLITPTILGLGFPNDVNKNLLVCVCLCATGTKIFVTTESGTPGMENMLRLIYDLYTDYVLKNPFYEVEMPIRCELWDLNLAQLVRKDGRAGLTGRWTKLGQENLEGFGYWKVLDLTSVPSVFSSTCLHSTNQLFPNNLSSCLVQFLTLDAPTCYTDNAILAPEQWGTQANYHAARP